ncbi:MAG: T9SS type A sorting domain-containing protein [Bacteroidales bacterium]|nr:T9SS type A sorting domain-containing protein [Bacteroidales bacterium]
MKKWLPFTAILFFWAASAIAGDLIPFSDSHASFSFAIQESAGQQERDVEIFPNPVTEGRVTITSSESILSVQVLNITGKMVFNQDYQPNTNSVVVELDKMEKGIYLVRIVFPGKITHTEKIMIK